MKNRHYYHLILALFLFSPLSFGCPHLSQSGPPFYRGPDTEFFENLISNSENKLKQDTSFKYILAKDDELRVVGFHPRYKDKALTAPLLLRFVWFSDVHLRQREIRLYHNWISQIFDQFVPTTTFNDVQMDFHWAVYFSHIAAINQLHQEQPLDFMIHTGDSVDTGSVEELYQFIYITNKLEKIPWLNLVGNHDFSIFGNFWPRLGYGRKAQVIYYPVGNLGDFIWMHRHWQEIDGFGRYLLPVPRNSGHEPSLKPYTDKKLPDTFYHGFDLGWECLENCKECPCQGGYRTEGESCANCLECPCAYPGYYRADLSNIDTRVRLIALNSAVKDGFGKWCQIENKQQDWLQKIMKQRPEEKDINLLFLHHRPKECSGFDDLLAKLAKHSQSTLVAFSGDSHEFHVELHKGQNNGSGFYELNSGSVLYFPQIAQLIELRGTPGDRIWLISRALWNSLITVREKDMPSKENIKNILEKCRSKSKREHFQQDLSEAVCCANCGGYQDHLDNLPYYKWRFWDPGTQSFDKIWNAANVIIQIQP